MALTFSDEEWAILASRLLDSTKNGSVKWQQVARDPRWEPVAYAAELKSGTSYHLTSKDGDDSFPFVLTAKDSDGEVLASFMTVGYQGFIATAEDRASSAIDELFKLIGRTVSGAADTAKSLIAELDELAPRDLDEDPF
jgi:hypothetical protein